MWSGRERHDGHLRTVGSNVTSIAEDSSTSALSVTGQLTVNTVGTTLVGGPSGGNFTLSGGVTGTGNLILNENSAQSALTLSTTAVNNSGTIINSGTGTGSVTISAPIGSNVTSIVQNSSTSILTITGGLTVNSGGTTLAVNAGSTYLQLEPGVVTGTEISPW